MVRDQCDDHPIDGLQKLLSLMQHRGEHNKLSWHEQLYYLNHVLHIPNYRILHVKGKVFYLITYMLVNWTCEIECGALNFLFVNRQTRFAAYWCFRTQYLGRVQAQD